jgi:hypothetical protein
VPHHTASRPLSSTISHLPKHGPRQKGRLGQCVIIKKYMPTGSRWIGLRAGIRELVGDGLTEDQVIDAVCRGKPDQAAKRRKMSKV